MSEQTQEQQAEQIAELAEEKGRKVATAESLTSGLVAQRLGAAPGASSWFRGGLVSYHDEVKHSVLKVDEGPVVTEKAARQMAAGVAHLLDADFAVATTGAGGPDPQDGQPAGTVLIAVQAPSGCVVEEHHFGGEPEEVVQQSTEAALRLLLESLRQV